MVHLPRKSETNGRRGVIPHIGSHSSRNSNHAGETRGMITDRAVTALPETRNQLVRLLNLSLSR